MNQSTNIYTVSDIEILISTMNRDSLDFLIPMFPVLHFSNFSILIINQIEKGKKLTSNYPNIRVINSLEKGLARSRNLALKNALGKILVIADDDVIYQAEFLSGIISSYNKFPKAAVINFCALNSEGNLIKKYPLNSKKDLNILDVFNTSSIEMTLNKTIFSAAEVEFDVNFGLGGIFEMGEEAIFLFDLKRKNKQLVFQPQIIVKHEGLTTSNKKNIIESYYILGALFTRIYKNNYIFGIIIKLLFDLKQNKIGLKNIKTVIRSANRGHKEYQKIKNK